MQFRRLVPRTSGLLLAALLSLAAAPAQQPAAPSFSAFQGGGPLLGVAPELPAPPMSVRWTYKADETDRAAIEGSPVIHDGTVYVADGKGVLHAIDLTSGKARWTYATGDAFATTPLILDGKVYLGDLSGMFHCVSAADGKKLWAVDAEASIHSSANASGNKIIFGTDGAEIFCLDAADGKVLWKGKAGDRVNAAVSIGNGLAYVSGCDAQIRAFDLETGEEKFTADLGALAPGSAAFVNDRLVVGTDSGRVVSLSADGKTTHWTYDGVEGGAMVYASPAVADGVVVVGARDRNVHGIDLNTGKRLWAFKTRGDVDAPALISSGRAYVGSKDKRLYVLDLKTGKKLWEFSATRSIDGGPAIADGALVVADSAGSVYCLEKK